MNVAYDMKGTLDAWPKQLGETMTALKENDNVIYIITGITAPHVNDDDVTAAQESLNKIGITPAMYDHLVVCPAPHPKSKAAAVKEHKIDILVDNKIATAKKVAKLGCLVLVPFSTAEK